VEKKMKRRDYHHHHHHHHHEHPRRTLRCGSREGFVKRTIKGLANKFNTSKGVIILGFVILFMFSGFFALLVFFLSYHWVKNPGKLEDLFDRTVEKSRNVFEHVTSTEGGFQKTATAGNGGSAFSEDDFGFADLKRQFDDLEARANDMEEHVSSDEYQLNKEFDDIK
jgi:phage shock protein PspC (stress-responsive transcriptional regulator)